MPVTPHDAEEAMRPTLGQLHDAIEGRTLIGLAPTHGETAATNALDKALELLGVQR